MAKASTRDATTATLMGFHGRVNNLVVHRALKSNEKSLMRGEDSKLYQEHRQPEIEGLHHIKLDLELVAKVAE